MSLGEKDQWWDRVEVSSNGHRKDRLVDGDPTTYWESAGRSGSHHIRFYMKKDLVVRYYVCIHVLLLCTVSYMYMYLRELIMSQYMYMFGVLYLGFCRKMYLHVSSRDSTYMPQRVTIHGGHSPNHVMDVSTVSKACDLHVTSPYLLIHTTCMFTGVHSFHL